MRGKRFAVWIGVTPLSLVCSAVIAALLLVKTDQIAQQALLARFSSALDDDNGAAALHYLRLLYPPISGEPPLSGDDSNHEIRQDHPMVAIFRRLIDPASDGDGDLLVRQIQPLVAETRSAAESELVLNLRAALHKWDAIGAHRLKLAKAKADVEALQKKKISVESAYKDLHTEFLTMVGRTEDGDEQATARTPIFYSEGLLAGLPLIVGVPDNLIDSSSVKRALFGKSSDAHPFLLAELEPIRQRARDIQAGYTFVTSELQELDSQISSRKEEISAESSRALQFVRGQARAAFPALVDEDLRARTVLYAEFERNFVRLVGLLKHAIRSAPSTISELKFP